MEKFVFEIHLMRGTIQPLPDNNALRHNPYIIMKIFSEKRRLLSVHPLEMETPLQSTPPLQHI